MRDSEMDSVNALLRAELERFKDADEAVRQQVVAVIADVNALDWLVELCENDKDPKIKAYLRIVKSFLNSQDNDQ